jgi:hypothetical protein
LAELPHDLLDAWRIGDFRRIAEAIDTGLGAIETSRALVVFNKSQSTLAGSIVFPVDMPWRIGREFPPVRIVHQATGAAMPHSIQRLVLDPPDSASPYSRLRFDLLFAVIPLVAIGWDTYVAEYATAVQSAYPVIPGTPIDASRYVVIECVRHGGRLPCASNVISSRE